MPDTLNESPLYRITDLASNQCRWPHGAPLARPAFFCGQPTRNGKCYCDVHFALAFSRSNGPGIAQPLWTRH